LSTLQGGNDWEYRVKVNISLGEILRNIASLGRYTDAQRAALEEILAKLAAKAGRDPKPHSAELPPLQGLAKESWHGATVL
jgi:hypothetical protein